MAKKNDKEKKDNWVTINGKRYYRITRVVGKIQNRRGDWVSKYKQFYGKNRKEAVAKYEAYMRKLEAGTLDDKKCFGEWVSWYRENVYKYDSSITDSTKTLHVNSFNNIFGDSVVMSRPLKDIKGADLQAVISSSELKPTTKRHAVSFLKRLYKYLEGQFIARDITKGLVAPKVEHKAKDQEIITYSEEELKAFLDKTSSPEDKRLRLLIVLAIHTGARIGELTALTYDDFKDGQVYINKSLKEINPIKGSGEKTKAIISETKTKTSIRTNPYGEFVQKEINKHRQWHLAEMMENSYRTNQVFTTSSGQLYFISSLRTALARLCKRISVQNKGWHCFRRTFGTKLANSGAPIQTVSKLMGHDSITVTAKYYVGINEEEKKNAVLSLKVG